MHDENELSVMTVEMTGCIILGLIWTLLVSALLFGLTGGGDASPANGRLDLSITAAPVIF
ncbi:MAG TPA: hypothetical protein VGE08_13080 [Steroidobacter sp.]|uniref:hypothetical protein n=1 Tax=Steroidobacter sp. TaxID=1978227 RepID=UPI002ED955F3